jgi:hypothetical protein
MKPFIIVFESNVIFVSSNKFWTWWNLNLHDRNIGCWCGGVIFVNWTWNKLHHLVWCCPWVNTLMVKVTKVVEPHLAPMRWSTNCSHWCMIWHRGANHLGHHESRNMWKFGGMVRCLVNKSRILFHYGRCPTRILNIMVGYTLSFFIFGNLVNRLKDETMLKHADIHKKKTKK